MAISALENVKCRKEKLFADLIGEVSPIDAAATTLGPRKKSNCTAKGGGAIAVWALARHTPSFRRIMPGRDRKSA